MAILTTADVRSVEFTERRKGYDPDEIAAFIDDICETIAAQKDAIEAATAKETDLSSRVTELESALAQVRSELETERSQNTQALEEAAVALEAAKIERASLVEQLENSSRNSEVSESVELLASAHKTAEETIARANEHAQRTRDDADAYASETRESADTYAGQVREEADQDAAGTRRDAEAEVETLRSQAAELRAGQEAYRDRIVGVLRSALEFMEGAATTDTVIDGDANDDAVFTDDGNDGEHDNGTEGGFFQ